MSRVRFSQSFDQPILHEIREKFSSSSKLCAKCADSVRKSYLCTDDDNEHDVKHTVTHFSVNHNIMSILKNCPSIGSLSEIRQNGDCTLCRLVTALIADRWAYHPFNSTLTEAELISILSTHGEMWICWWRDTYTVCKVQVIVFEEYVYLSPQFCLDEDVGHSIIGSIQHLPPVEFWDVGPPSIASNLQTNTLRWCIRRCREEHNMECHFLGTQSNDPVEIYLVDCHDLCVVQGKTSLEYVAFSYVWGNVTTGRLLNENLNILQRPGSLEVASFYIPQSIRDAMKLCKDLGFHYLWVDALCIVQDNEVLKQRHLNAMDTIYQSAFLTLIAGSTQDANGPLAGVSSKSRAPIRRFAYANGTWFMSTPPSPSISMAASIYDTRGWTFQERFLSSRIICLSRHQAVYGCRFSHTEEIGHNRDFEEDESLQTETGHLYLPRIITDLVQRKLPPSHVPRPGVVFAAYTRVVSAFAIRTLTYPSDVLAAFAGVASFIERRIGSGKPGSMVFGLLSSLLDASLCWFPASSCTRREPSMFPSWSWVGWQGAIRYDMATSWIPPEWEIPDSAPLEDWIRNDFNGYSKTKELQRELGYSFGCGVPAISEFAVRHPHQPGFKTIQRQPNDMVFPLAWDRLERSREQDPLQMDLWAYDSPLPLLVFRAQCAKLGALQIAAMEAYNTSPYSPFRMRLWGPDGREVGVFKGLEYFSPMCSSGISCSECNANLRPKYVPRLKDEYEKEISPPSKIFCLDQQGRGECELVFMSFTPHGMIIDGVSLEDGQIHFMLIRWVGKHAERVAIGKIRSNAWESLRREVKTVYLA